LASDHDLLLPVRVRVELDKRDDLHCHLYAWVWVTVAHKEAQKSLFRYY
jgi:hypothetical protein